MRFTIMQHAEEGTRYAPGCFDASIAKHNIDDINIRIKGQPAARGRLVSAKIAEDGTAAELTFQIDDQAALASLLRTEKFENASFGFNRVLNLTPSEAIPER